MEPLQRGLDLDDTAIWEMVARRLTLFLGASGIEPAALEAQKLASKLRAKHGHLPLEAALRLGLAATTELRARTSGNDVGDSTPARAPLTITKQQIKPVVSTQSLRLTGWSFALVAIAPGLV